MAKGVATFATLATAFAAIGALYLTNQTLDATRQQNAVTEQGQYTDRFGRAVEQLGSEKTDIRLGGIYALERLTRDSPRDAGTITNVLGAYVRNHAPCPSPAATTPKSTLPTDVAAALTVLTRRPLGSPVPRDPALVLADVKGVCLGHRDLVFADFANLDLSNVDLSGSNMPGFSLAGVFLNQANLAGAFLFQSDWLGTSASNANLTNANLTFSTLRNTSFFGATLRGARLDNSVRESGSVKTKTHVTIDLNTVLQPGARSPSFRVADLTDASFRAANLPEASFLNARLESTDFTEARLPLSNFVNATALNGTRFDRADLSYSVFKGLDLRHVSFTNADLTGADLSNTDLRGVDLSTANLAGANMTGARR